MIQRHPIRLGVLMAACGLSACAATQVSSIHKDPAFNPKALQNVLAIAVVRKPATQKMLEDEFVKRLQKNGSQATASHTLLGEGQKLDEAAWKKMIKEHHFGTVIVSRLVDFNVEEQNVEPKYVQGVGGGYGYYNVGYHVVYQPGFTIRKETAAVETRVFDVASEKLMWSGRSKTDIEEGRDPEAQVRDFVRLMVSKIYD
jgi:hypothetical protein